MADPEQLDILRRGVRAWNEWRSSFEGRVNLSGADLFGANLYGADLSGAKLYNVNLSGADLSKTILSGTDLSGAKLYGANLSEADLPGADLSKALLSGTNLSRTNLSRTNLSRANLSRALLSLTTFARVDLSSTKGLETCKHLGPSALDFNTLARSGPLPEVFLRGCGLPDLLIEYLPSLLNQPIQFYSCFISYTEADVELATRLYNDLQGEGVRCWLFPEDAVWGKSIYRNVDEAIRLHDKVVVLLSEDSLRSGPVLREIERALQHEDQLYRAGEEPEVLFPIRLDGYVHDAWKHPRKADIRMKTIGDFSDWKDRDAYRAAFDRLLKGLRPDPPRPS